MGKTRFFLVLMVFVSGFVQAQVNRYMVFFNNKTGTPFNISSPGSFLSERALQRRENQEIEIKEEDLPVNPAYVTQVRNAGIKVLYRTKWMNGVLVEATAAQLPTIAGLSCVSSVEEVAPGARPSVNGRIRSSKKFKETDGASAATDVQLSLIGLDNLHRQYNGEGMLIAVLDAGFPGADTISLFKRVFTEGRFDAATSFDFVSGGSNVFRHNDHGTKVWSIIAGYKVNQYKGGAHKAKFILFVTEHSSTEYRVEEYNWLFAAERADSAGVDVINTSLGYFDFDDNDMNYSVADLDGETAIITRAAEIAASKGIAVVVSAGNEGLGNPTSIGAPADGPSVLSVGAVTSTGIRSGFSSTGPTADGRIKPDIAAMGTAVSISNAAGAIVTGNGTSFSAPLMTSLVAVSWQRQPSLKVQALFDTIRVHGNQHDNPDNLLGHGIPDFNYLITGIEEEVENQISLFPNPTHDQLRIEFSETVQLQEMRFSLIDSKGSSNVVVAQQVNEHEILFDLSGLQSGLYILRCQRGNRHSIHKVLKIE